MECRVAGSGRPRNRYTRRSSSRALFLDSALSCDAEKWAVERAAQQVQGVMGLTSNHTIFDHVVKNSHDYDDAIRRGLKGGKSWEELLACIASKGEALKNAG